ncbi:secondary thiamine-phosphate synthase enzyme YjbQ [Desulforhopalus sp. 52FAK]
MNKGKIQVSTNHYRELIDITHEISATLSSCTSGSGLLFLFNPHTTAGLTINEGADPDVQTDIIEGLNTLVPNLNYRHAEGNSPAHIMTLLTGSSLTIEVENGQLQLGTWQRIFFCEYDGPRTRSINWKFLPDNS